MHTIDIIGDQFPHGTPRGFTEGCRGAACPALISCRDIHTRYAGDWSFKRLIDAGTPLEEIIARERAERDGVRERDRAATHADRHAEARTTRTTRARAAQRKPSSTRGRGAPHAATLPARTAPALSPPVAPESAAPRVHPGYAWLSDAETLAAELTVEQAVDWRRALDEYRSALDAHVADLTGWAADRRRRRAALRSAKLLLEQTRIALSTGISLDGAISAAADAARAEYDCALAAWEEHAASAKPEPPARPRRPRHRLVKRTPAAPRELKPHGTNACRARGCDRPECIEAGRQYHRAWVAERQGQNIETKHHGTAYGYQLGCKDRSNCPAEISCADASLNEERRRARQAGIPEQAPRVPAEPVRERVRELMASGMTILSIAADAQVSKTGIKILLYGRSGARKGELPAAIEQAKADRIMQLKPHRGASSRTA